MARKRPRLKTSGPLVLLAALGALGALGQPPPAAGAHSWEQVCGALPHHLSRHLKLCKLVQASGRAGDALATGAARGLAECRAQFRAERWNCSLAAGRPAHHEHLLLAGALAQSLGNRESAFLQAIAGAGVVHAVAAACSAGSLTDCACDKTRIGSPRPKERGPNENPWRWGGCSNNIPHGMMYAKHLVELLDALHQQQVHARPRRSPPPQTNNLCGHNQSLPAGAHAKLVRSLLASNSLEKHAEMRLAVNLHNNKVGRMAVARNMERKCRCHGLSGSCSLKTCWLTLPNFQLIGAYLKRKYESSVHLPSAINVNKLIPLMDRNEISAILTGVGPPAPRPPEFAALTAPRAPLTGHFIVPAGGAPTSTAPPAHLDHYERHHKQLAQVAGAEAPADDEAADEAAAELQPLSGAQLAALLRDARLCNASAPAGPAPGLAARDLAGGAARRLGRPPTSPAGGQQPRAAAHQLSQLLAHANRDDLVHLHRSPDYCEPDLLHGFPGVKSRSCSDNPQAPDHCDKFCCGRGHTAHVIQHSYKCDCEFEYCCSIKCKVCTKEVKLLACN